MEAATSVWAVNPDAPLQEVAKAAGVDRATLYRHFPTRAALFQTVAPPAFDEIGGLLVDLPTEGPALPVLTSLIEPFIGLGNRYAFVVTHATAATQDRAVDVALSESLEALIEHTRAVGLHAELADLLAKRLAQPTTSYNVLVQVMDTVREGVPAGVDPKSKGAYVELFPDISIGDAPISVAKK